MSGGEFAAIEARANAASVGPWETRTGTDATVTSASIHAGWTSILFERDGYHFGYANIADAEFIAHAREDVPALLAAVRERDNTIARVRKCINDYESLGTRPWNALRAALDPQETP